jgi:hypothetical protein
MNAPPHVPRHLIHPGFAKAGSTFLQEWFARHPQMRYVPNHLGGFRDVFDLVAAAREASPTRWRYYVTSNELLGGGGRADQGCPLFTFRMNVDAELRPRQRSVCALLHEHYPDARVLIVTRGFAGIIRSLYSQYVKFGGSRDFEGFLHRYAYVLEQWLDVEYTVGLYRAAFGDRLLVLPYEWLRDDTRGFIAAIEEFLEIEHFEEPIPGVRNPSLGPSELYWYPRVSRWIVSPVLERLPPERSGPLYSAYAFKVLSSEQLASGARWVSRRLGRTDALEFPPGYLERFRGRASCLASSRPHRPYLDDYLVDANTDP